MRTHVFQEALIRRRIAYQTLQKKPAQAAFVRLHSVHVAVSGYSLHAVNWLHPNENKFFAAATEKLQLNTRRNRTDCWTVLGAPGSFPNHLKPNFLETNVQALVPLTFHTIQLAKFGLGAWFSNRAIVNRHLGRPARGKNIFRLL